MKWHFFFLQKLKSSTCFRVSEPEGCGKIQEWCILWVHLWFLIPSLLTNCWSWTHNLGGEVQNVYILSHLLHTRWSQGTLFLGNVFHFIVALHGHHSHLYKRKWKLWELNDLPTASREWVISNSICLAVEILPLSLPQGSSAKCLREWGRQASSQSRVLFKYLLVWCGSHTDSRVKAAIRTAGFAQAYGVS